MPSPDLKNLQKLEGEEKFIRLLTSLMEYFLLERRVLASVKLVDNRSGRFSGKELDLF